MAKVLLLLQVSFLAIFVKAQWPCPEASDIAPCLCYVGGGTDLDLDCSAITDDAALTNVFQAAFPFTKFRYFNIVGESASKPVNIQHFDQNIFGNIYFQFVYIKNTMLTTLVGDPFEKSQDTLEILEMTNNELTTYPFDSLPSYTVLTRLRLDNNNLGRLSNINSQTLTYLNLNNNQGLKYGDQAFYNAPNLRTLLLKNIGLTNIAPNTYRYLSRLATLDLSNNGVHILWRMSFWFESTNLKRVTINDNILDVIEEGAIDFCEPNEDPQVCETPAGATAPDISMVNNLLIDLPKNVWEEAFMLPSETGGVQVFNFMDNPISCGCNIGWLVIEPNYLGRVVETSTCDNGNTFAQLSPPFFEAVCKTPGTAPSIVKH